MVVGSDTPDDDVGQSRRPKSYLFESIYGDHFEKVYRCVYAFCGDADLAFDSTQEAFARALARWPRLAKEQWVEGWIVTTALNCSRRHFRLLKKRAREPVDRGEEVDIDSRLDVRDHVRDLPARQRQAVVLYYLADCPIATVAVLMDTSESSVKSLLDRARTSLRQRIEAPSG